jgi:hypothetical protein
MLINRLSTFYRITGLFRINRFNRERILQPVYLLQDYRMFRIYRLIVKEPATVSTFYKDYRMFRIYRLIVKKSCNPVYLSQDYRMFRIYKFNREKILQSCLLAT